MALEITRRRFLNAMAGVAGAAALAACAPKAEPTAAPAPQAAAPKAEAPAAPPKAAAKEVELRYMSWWGAYNTTCVPDFLKDFKDVYPNITVNLEEITGQLQVYQTCFVAGTCADIVYHDNFMSKFYDEGVVLQLDDYYERDNIDFEKDFYHGLALELWKGKLYGFPHMYESCVLFYNKDLLMKHWGKDLWEAFPDGDWDITDMQEIADACTVDTNGDGVIDQWGLYVNYRDYYYGMEWSTWSAGGNIYDLDNVQYTFTNDVAKRSYQWLYDGIKGPKPWIISNEDYSEVTKALAVNMPFMAQKTAMRVRMCTDVGRIIGSVGPGDGSKGFNWDIFYLPGVDGHEVVTRGGGHPNCISKSTKSPDEAWSVIKELGTTMGQKYVGATKMSIPIYRKDPSLRDTLVVGVPQHDNVMLDALEKKGGYGDHLRFHTEGECRTIMSNAVDLVYASDYDPTHKDLDATFAKIETEMNAAVDYGGDPKPYPGIKWPFKPAELTG
jgi:ABC-type glycerol-3-phosphate transport system substrate-binding protein